jgi:hypothetical protein
MSAGKTVLAALGVGGAALVGAHWYRRWHGERLAAAMNAAADFRAMLEIGTPTADAEYWAEMGRPATTPNQRTTPGGRGLTRLFDPLFAAYGGSIPVPYLRALAYGESGLNASDAKGLINVVGVAIDDYNRRHGTKYRPEDMRTPDINVRIATDILQTIITSYRKNHPDVANLQEDWNNRAFVELVTLGWNAGYSEASGVGKVVNHLKKRGQKTITVDDIHKLAPSAGASRWLWEPPIAAAKLAWSKGVARRYFAEKERDTDAASRLVAINNRASRPEDP